MSLKLQFRKRAGAKGPAGRQTKRPEGLSVGAASGTRARIRTSWPALQRLRGRPVRRVLRQPLRSVTTQEFRVTGSWADPQVQKLDRSLAAPATEPATPLQ